MSEPYPLLIVGGGPAGLAAARGYREAGGAGRVAIVTDEYRVPYNRPPLTKDLLRGESTVDELPLEEEEWFDQQRVELIGGRAVALNATSRTVSLSGGRELRYEQSLLATGAEPKRLPVPGADHPRVVVLRALHHLRDLTDRLDAARRVAVIGSGFIGCEIASSLRMRGHQVALVSDEPAPNAARLGREAAGLIGGWLERDGVELHLGSEVAQIVSTGSGSAVVAGEVRIECDLVVMAAGVAPRGELAAQAGLELDGGAIPTDSAMQTGLEGVLAAGDVCKARNEAAGRALRVEHWGDALGQGELAGAVAAGRDARWDSVPGFWSTIGKRTLKYTAWGDGYEQEQVLRHADGGFTAWYGAAGRVVGVLTHEADADYEDGERQIAQGAPWPF